MDATILFEDGHTSKIYDVESITERIDDIIFIQKVVVGFQIKHKAISIDLDNIKQIKISW